MLERTQQGLLKELHASEAQLRPHLANYDLDLMRICGPYYGRAGDFLEGDPENHWYETLARFLPELVYANPQCSVSIDGYEWPPERSIAIESACNTWAQLIDLRHDLERCASDYLIRWSVGILQAEPLAGYEDAEDPPYLPGFTRLSPHDFRWDSTVRDIRKSRWMSHRSVQDIEDVIHEAERDRSLGWNLKLLKRMERGTGPDPEQARRFGVRVIADRKCLITWDVWDRAHRLDDAPPEKDGWFGTLWTIVDQPMSDRGPVKDPLREMIREPRPCFGPRRGPYCVQGAQLIGDLVHPLSPLVANAAQAKYLNNIARAIMKQVMDYKRILVANSQALADRIQFEEDGTVFAAEGESVKDVLASLEAGGLTPQMLAAKQDARQTLDQGSGVTQPDRGNIQGVATAREVMIAQGASELKSSFMVEKYRDFVRQIFSGAGFHFDVNKDVVLDIGPLPFALRDRQGRLTRSARIRGGMPRGKGWSALDHERANYQIDPFSMRRSDEQVKAMRYQLLNATLGMIAQLPPQIAVSFNLPWYLKQAEAANGIKDLDQLFDPKVFYAIQSQILQLGQTVEPSPQRNPQPRFGVLASTPMAASGMGPGAPPGGRALGRGQTPQLPAGQRQPVSLRPQQAQPAGAGR